jgi:hypothetical protein
MASLKPYEKNKIVYNSLNLWNLEVSNSLKEAALPCASVEEEVVVRYIPVQGLTHKFSTKFKSIYHLRVIRA